MKALALILFSSTTMAAGVKCLTVETTLKSTLNNGVTRHDTFQDLRCFDNDNIWIKRLNTLAPQQHAAHKELDVELMTQWYHREQQQIVVELIDEHQQLRIPLQKGEWDVLMFNGDFATLLQAQKATSATTQKIVKQNWQNAPWLNIASWRQKDFSDFSD